MAAKRRGRVSEIENLIWADLEAFLRDPGPVLETLVEQIRVETVEEGGKKRAIVHVTYKFDPPPKPTLVARTHIRASRYQGLRISRMYKMRAGRTTWKGNNVLPSSAAWPLDHPSLSLAIASQANPSQSSRRTIGIDTK
ncbi:MAG: hypothetical protein KJ970_12370 [Candidatus Eisenbacteria bacterium]|uniref:Uncharacterized protein n=1 Tax=Eiseniibacteriota bacterium TaxID=2212470 RepID=A0A948RY50_UNCEI|nr:hypothetical protein [Candidatus Eisenbacteria bacterium]MBU2691712.1 hypothetical protein [Candidatus Eisenbacteria bacterium]